MKNECQKDGVPGDPLIFVAPTLNLVTILSVGWLDNIGRTAVFRENGRLELSDRRQLKASEGRVGPRK